MSQVGFSEANPKVEFEIRDVFQGREKSDCNEGLTKSGPTPCMARGAGPFSLASRRHRWGLLWEGRDGSLGPNHILKELYCWKCL